MREPLRQLQEAVAAGQVADHLGRAALRSLFLLEKGTTYLNHGRWVLCCGVLCCAVLCCAVLCCATGAGQRQGPASGISKLHGSAADACRAASALPPLLRMRGLPCLDWHSYSPPPNTASLQLWRHPEAGTGGSAILPGTPQCSPAAQHSVAQHSAEQSGAGQRSTAHEAHRMAALHTQRIAMPRNRVQPQLGWLSVARRPCAPAGPRQGCLAAVGRSVHTSARACWPAAGPPGGAAGSLHGM